MGRLIRVLTVTAAAVGFADLSVCHADTRRAPLETVAWLPKKDEPKDKPRYFETNVNLKRVSLAKFAESMKLKLPFDVGGEWSFQLKVAIPLNNLGDYKTYRVKGTVEVEKLRLAGVNIDLVTATVNFADGVLVLDDVIAKLGGDNAGTLLGKARLPIAPLGELTANLKATRVPFARLGMPASWAERVRGELAGTIDLKVPLDKAQSPEAWLVDAQLSLPRLDAYGLTLQDTTAKAQLKNGTLRLDDIHGHVYDGTLNGNAIVPLRPAGTASLDLRFKDVNAGAMAKSMAAMPVSLEGRVDGAVKASLAFGDNVNPTVNVAVQATRLRVQGIPTERVHGTVDLRDGKIDYRVEGSTLGGTFELDGGIPPAQASPQKKDGVFRVKGAKLSRVHEILRLPPQSVPLRGLVDVDFSFRHDGPERVPVGTGRFVVTRPRWADTEIAEQVQGEIVLTRQELRLREIVARIGEGLLRAQVSISLRRYDLSWFVIHLDGVEVSRLLAPWPDSAGSVEGRLDGRVRGRLGQDWSGTADLHLGRGKILGMEVVDWRLPLNWSLAPTEGRGEVTLHDSAAQLAGGRATAQASLGWGAGLRVEGHVRANNVDLRTLLRDVGEVSQIGGGRVSGRFDFSGADVRSVDDLNGILVLKLTQTQALQYPGLQQVAPFLGMQTSFAFETGELRARLSRGFFRIECLALSGPNVQVFVQGIVTLAGRLDLDVLARMGTLGIEPARLRLLGLFVPLQAEVPLAVLSRASAFLSNRILRLRVTGTVRNPVVRIEPLALLTQEALQFFVNRALLPLP
jgi:translocation and assembly module TamB